MDKLKKALKTQSEWLANRYLYVGHEPYDPKANGMRYYELREPGRGWMNTTTITRNERGEVFIAGDYAPHPSVGNGIGCAHHAGWRWFIGGPYGPGYTAEKFRIPDVYDEDAACAEIREWIDDINSDIGEMDGDDPERERYERRRDELTELVEDGDVMCDATRVYDALHDAGFGDYCDEGPPGFILDPGLLAPTMAIHRRFLELWREHCAETGHGNV